MGWLDLTTYQMDFTEAEAANPPFFIKSITQNRRYKGSDRTSGTFWEFTEFAGAKCLTNVKIENYYRVDCFMEVQLTKDVKWVIEYGVDSEKYDTFDVWVDADNKLEAGGSFSGWQTFEYALNSSNTQLQFGYLKDSSNSYNSDRAYIKSITFYDLPLNTEVRWLVHDGEGYKTVKDAAWVSLGNNPTKETILAEGAETPPQPEMLIQLNNPTVYKWHADAPLVTPKSFTYISIPKDQIWAQTTSVGLDAPYIKGIKSVVIDYNKSDTASIVFVFSNNNGTTWNYLTSDGWHAVEYSLEAIKQHGMQASFIKGISENDWQTFMGESRIIKLACVVSVLSSSDYVRLNSIQYNFIVEGVD